MEFIATRPAALQRLADFAPRAGRAYQANRNHDTGPDWPHVSALSPHLHAGLLSEAEVLEAVLAQHKPNDAYKFISEVFWRVYFKGYLEHRPAVWRAFCEQRDAALAEVAANSGKRTGYAEATEGRTRIAAFDVWAKELVETGYLHNHARMWFASIWIFTLKLDWTLGADFFARHLLCGDAASNTLSWRWVAGLHTKGKSYAARQGNITRYTAERPNGPLKADGLASEAPALSEPNDIATKQTLKLPDPAPLPQRYALLLHDEAASYVPLEAAGLLPYPPSLIITAARPEARSPEACGEPALDFARSAVRDGGQEASETFGCPVADWADDNELTDLLAQHEIDTLALPFLPIGWTRDALAPQIAPLAKDGRTVTLLQPLSRAAFPHAKAGFFGVKKKMDQVMREVGIAGAG